MYSCTIADIHVFMYYCIHTYIHVLLHTLVDIGLSDAHSLALVHRASSGRADSRRVIETCAIY